MAEPIPSAGSPEQASLPTNAEDRKAAAALSALNANDMSAQGEDSAGGDAAEAAGGIAGAGGKVPSAADQEALGKAMSQLEIVAGGKKTTPKKKEQQEKEEAAAAAAAAEAKRKRAIKVSAEDVALLVDELDLTKPKATDFLKSHDGDPVKAIRAYLAPHTTTVK
ncbi:hypothetical protein FQN54_001837 [Arachnomyces sp. PD_36]|nr:hypothetical protein FQN54_001837 [Arachnomyces sp. PD_36]